MSVVTWPTTTSPLRTTQRRRLVTGRQYAFGALCPMPSPDRTCPGRPPTPLGPSTPFVTHFTAKQSLQICTSDLRVDRLSFWPARHSRHHRRCCQPHTIWGLTTSSTLADIYLPADDVVPLSRRAAALHVPPAVQAWPSVASHALPS